MIIKDALSRIRQAYIQLWESIEGGADNIREERSRQKRQRLRKRIDQLRQGERGGGARNYLGKGAKAQPCRQPKDWNLRLLSQLS